jgi:glycosyltransferase involved in cell wall biosynthesis
MTNTAPSQDKAVIELDPNFSTTRLVTREKPTIVNDPSSKVQSLLFLPPNSEREGEGGLRTKALFKRSYDEVNSVLGNSTLPLVTIITVVFNGEKYLEQTILSVLNQTYNNVEYIVIDGGSTDATVDIIRKYEEKIDYWVSEKDHGISDAFNKGIRCSTGKLIGMINSDDWYQVDSVNAVVNFYRTLEIQERNNFVSFGNLFYPEGNVLQFGDKNYSRLINYLMPHLNHPSVFVAKNVYSRVGLFNKSFKFAMDFEFLKRCHKNGISFNYINKLIVNMRGGGISNKCRDETLREVALLSDNKFITQYYSFYFLWFYRFGLLKSILNKQGKRIFTFVNKQV